MLQLVGYQLTLGHFQLQAWTAGLVLGLGLWRVGGEGRPLPARRAGAGPCLWASKAIAQVQLTTSLELTRLEGFTWSAPQKLVQPKWESPGRLTHGGTHEKAKDRRGSGAVAP